jgi:kumamolisin
VGDQPDDEAIEVSIVLKPKARAAVPREGGAAVTREEFAARHGADSAAIEKVKQFAKENNLTVGEVSPERRSVKLEGTAGNMLRAFDVRLDRYEHEGHQYRARTGGIKLPPDLAPSVEAVLGLDDRPQAKPHFRVLAEPPPEALAAANVSYTPRQVAQLYEFPLDADGTGETVGILEMGGGYR